MSSTLLLAVPRPRDARARGLVAVIVILILLALSGGLAFGQEEPPSVPPDGDASHFQGTLSSWDDASRTFTVRGAGENEMTFTWTDTTTFDGAPKTGDSVSVDYTVTEGRHVATHVAVQDAQPAPGGDDPGPGAPPHDPGKPDPPHDPPGDPPGDPGDPPGPGNPPPPDDPPRPEHRLVLAPAAPAAPAPRALAGA